MISNQVSKLIRDQFDRSLNECAWKNGTQACKPLVSLCKWLFLGWLIFDCLIDQPFYWLIDCSTGTVLYSDSRYFDSHYSDTGTWRLSE